MQFKHKKEINGIYGFSHFMGLKENKFLKKVCLWLVGHRKNKFSNTSGSNSFRYM